MMLDTTLSILPTLIQWDTQVFLAVNGCHHPFFDSFMEMYSDRFIWLPFYLSIAYAVYRQFHWKAMVVFLGLALLLLTINDQLSSSVFRSAFARMRPSNPDNPLSAVVHIVDGYRGGRFGFPSAHAANSWGLATLVSLTFRRRLLMVMMLAWATVMCYSRMYLGVHYFGDVLCGALLGSLTASLFYFVFQHKLRPLADRLKLTTVPAPWLALPVAVCGIELAVMLLVSLFVIL